MKRPILLLALAAFFASGGLHAQVPRLVNYQGRVAVGAVNFDGTGLFKFALVNSAGTTTFWSNDGASVAGSQPTNAVSLPVSKGLYSVLLGDVALTNMTAIPASVFTNADVRLRVWFNDGVNGSQLLAPDQRLAPASYIADGTVTNAAIASGAIDGTRVAPASLNASHLTVANPPTAGQVLTFDGASLSWVPAAGGGGDSVFSLSGTNAYYLPGNVGLGTTTPTHRLTLAGGPTWTSNGWLGSIALPNASAIGWATNTAGQRFGMGHTNSGFAMFRTASDPGTAGSPALYDFFVSDVGSIGVGTISPQAKVHIYEEANSVTQLIEMGGGINGWAKVGFKNLNGQWDIGTSRGYNNDIFYIDRISTLPLEFQFSTWGALGLGIEPQTKVHLYEAASSVSQRIQTGAGTNAWTRVEFTNGNGQWNLGTSRSYNGDQLYFHREGSSTIAFGVQPNGDAFLEGTMSCKVLTIRGGADVAEPFAMPEEISKGAVVVIDEENPGQLKLSSEAYDKRVAGIVSGANGVNPGIALHQEGVLDGGQNVALSGRVYVNADTSNGPIKPGDMLTTSDTPGYAMKVSDHARAQGAIIGKAMSALADGQGMVLVLVTLQ